MFWKSYDIGQFLCLNDKVVCIVFIFSLKYETLCQLDCFEDKSNLCQFLQFYRLFLLDTNIVCTLFYLVLGVLKITK